MHRVGIYSIEHDWDTKKVNRVLVGIAEFMSPKYALYYTEVGNDIVLYDSQHYHDVCEPGHTFHLERFKGKMPEDLYSVLTDEDCRIAHGESRLCFGDYENNAVISLDGWISAVQDYLARHPRLDITEAIAIVG